MKKILILLGIVLLGTTSYGQRRRFADRFFKEYSYKKSAELYKRIYKRGDSSAFILRRLGDSYYNNGNTKEAEKWYGKFINRNYIIDSLYGEYIFKYAQALKGNGKYEESDKWLLKLKELNPSDSRGESLVLDPDYLSDMNQDKSSYVVIYNVSANTKYSDFGTFVSGKEVYFASSRPTPGNRRLYNWNRQPFLNLYRVEEKLINLKEAGKKVNELNSKDVHKLTENINTRYHEASGVITKEGKTMYFTRDDYNGEKLGESAKHTVHLKLYKATLEGGIWTNIKELPFNDPNYSIGHPALSPDDRTLYFTSDMPGGYGQTDIYRVAILGKDIYQTPENLGRGINTEGRERFPFIDSKGTLYFSSDGHLGLGGLDIFKSKEVNKHYLVAENLGTPFNSRQDDFSFVFDNNLDKSGYFSSNRPGGKGDDDIYSFTIYECTQPVKGIVTDRKTGKVLSKASVRLIDSNGKVLQRRVTDAEGQYVFEKVDCGESYTVMGDKTDYKSNKKEVSTAFVNGNVIKSNLSLIPLVAGNKIVINPIYFNFGKHNVREDAKYELEHIVDVMRSHPSMVIKIESYTDSRGSKSYNRRLSDDRAKSTRDYIISRGIAAKRIASAIGYGEDRLLNNCDDDHQKKCTEAEHQLNRRSYFYIIKGGKNVSVSHHQKVK